MEEYTFTTISGVETVSEITVSIASQNSSGGGIDCYGNVYLGSWLGQKTFDVGTTQAEVTQTWSGLSGTQAELDGLQIRIIAWATIGKNQWCRIARVKAIVTYISSQPQHIGRISRAKSEAFFRDVFDMTVPAATTWSPGIGPIGPRWREGIYEAKYNFRDDEVDSFPADWEDRSTAGSATYIIATFNGHNKVMRLEDGATGGATPVILFGNQEYGTAEYYIASDDVSKLMYVNIRDEGGNEGGMAVGMRNGVWQYWNGSWNIVSGAPAPINDQWYRIRIDFECTTNGYEGLSQYDWHLYIDDVKYSGSGYDQYQTPSKNDIFYCPTQSSNYNIYIDAVDFSWTSGYSFGRNKILEHL